MMDGKSLSKMIRDKKKNLLKPDMDYAGQEALDPNTYEDLKQASEVNEALGEPDHEPASDSEMGENESSQDTAKLKQAMMRISRYMDMLGI